VLGSESPDSHRGYGGDDRVEASERYARQSPWRDVAAHQRRVHDGGERIAANFRNVAGAAGDPFPPAVFDAGMEPADQAGHQDGKPCESDPQPLGGGNGGQQRQRDGDEMRVALPPAHLARKQPEAVFRNIGPGEQDRRDAEGQALRELQRRSHPRDNQLRCASTGPLPRRRVLIASSSWKSSIPCASSSSAVSWKRGSSLRSCSSASSSRSISLIRCPRKSLSRNMYLARFAASGSESCGTRMSGSIPPSCTERPDGV